MAVRGWGHLFIQPAAPEEDPVQIGSLWADTSSTAVLKICTAVAPYTFVSSGANISDGDKGDITISGTGTVFTIDDGVVTPAKMNDGAACSALIRSANSVGVRADVAAAEGEFLRRRSNVLGFGPIIGADIVGMATPSEQTVSATGSQHNLAIASKYSFVRCTGASALVISGIQIASAAPSAGDTVILYNAGTSTVKVTNQDTNSTEANRIDTPSTNGQIIGVGGSIVLVYDGTDDRWKPVAVDPGDPISVTFNSGDFTGSGSMTWTVQQADVDTFAYQQRGRNLMLFVVVQNTSVGGTPSTTLQVAIPAGFVSANTMTDVCAVNDNGTTKTGAVFTGGGIPLGFNILAGGNWAAATNTTATYYSGEILVN